MQHPQSPAPVPKFNHAVRTIGLPGHEGLLGAGRDYYERNAWAFLDIVNEDYDLCYVTAGRSVYLCEGASLKIPLEPGCVFQRFPGVKHSTRPDPDLAYGESFIKIPMDLYTTLVAMGTVNPKRPVLRPGLDNVLIDQFQDILTQLRSASELEIPRTIARMHMLIATVYRIDQSSGSGDPYVLNLERACALLSQDNSEKSILELLRDLPVSYERFRKIFVQHLGISPGEYRIRRKMERARGMLRESPEYRSIKDIAWSLGYADSASFTKQFTARVGRPPDAFRRGAGGR